MSSEDMEKFRLIEAKKVYRPAIRDWLIGNFKSASWDQVRIFLSTFAPADDPRDTLSKLLRDCRRWEAEGKQPWQIKDEERGYFLQDDLLVALARGRGQLDHLSQIGSFVPPEDETETISWSTLSPLFLLSPFNAEKVSGGFLTVTGRPRVGKTGVGCDYAELWHDAYPDTEVLNNFPLERSVSWMRPATDLISLFQGISDALVAERRWLWGFDEPSLSGWMKMDAQSNRAKNLDRFARIVPKLQGSLLYIEQRIEGVPTVLQDFAQSHIACTSPGNIIADLPGQKISIRAVPKPRVAAYRTGEAGYFDLQEDFDWQGLFKALRYQPELLVIEAAKPATQGERIKAFLKQYVDSKPNLRTNVTCRFCAHTWQPKTDEPPARCPKCMHRNPTSEGVVINAEPEPTAS